MSQQHVAAGWKAAFVLKSCLHSDYRFIVWIVMAMLCPGGTPLYGLNGRWGMSCWRGCGSWPLCPKLRKSVINISGKSVLNIFHVFSPKQGIKLEGFDLNRVRVSNSPWLSYTKMLVDYPLPGNALLHFEFDRAPLTACWRSFCLHVVGQQVYEKKLSNYSNNWYRKR